MNSELIDSVDMKSEYESELNERLELAFSRIKEIISEDIVLEPFKSFFKTVAKYLIMLEKPEANKDYNYRLFSEILPENYDNCYGNPDFTLNTFKNADVKDYKEMAKLFSFLYAEMHSLNQYAFEKNIEVLTIYLELFIEIYVMFTSDDGILPKVSEIRDVIYWFNSDNCDIIAPIRLVEIMNPECGFAKRIIMESDLSNTDYLYKFGEYITDNEIKVSEFLAKMSEEDIASMASIFTEGYRIGFVKAGKPLDKKETVEIRFCLGFERIVKEAIKQFEKIGLTATISRASFLATNKSRAFRIGYHGAIPNKQYDYDHKDDRALFLDKDFINRKSLVTKECFEEHKDMAAKFAGPAVMEIFGEAPFAPITKNTAITLDDVADGQGNKHAIDLTDRISQITNQFINGEETSFTIIAYPIPEIGPDFADIFAETVKLNTLDYKRYETMQQTIIDVLDKAEEVRIEGKGTNKTNLVVKLQKITDATKQTKFENCVADVNIPVGEVFTSPVLKGTNGVLNVSKVYLNELNYEDLYIKFKDGMIVDYTCSNYEKEEESKKYIKSNVLFNRDSLPIGEFAIGTNTTAYSMARKYGIEDKLPILIGEKTGPHFAVGDTCYSHEEDVKVYNPDGKEVIARDNEITAKYRKTDTKSAYFNCHTDITIPYDELKGIYAIHEDGSETAIIENGKFVLEGLEELNIPLN